MVYAHCRFRLANQLNRKYSREPRPRLCARPRACLMTFSLNRVTTPIEKCLLRKGTRLFGLLGKATSYGISSFTRSDLHSEWAVTAEFGCLRLERLSGDEEVTSDHLILPTAASYDYGVSGPNQSPDTVRAVFGLLTSELEQLVTGLRRGGSPLLGYSRRDLRCSLSCCVIPGMWPHIVISNRAIYGNIVSLETFMRSVVASMPEGKLAMRFPELQPVFKQLMKLRIVQRRGILYTDELLMPRGALVTG